MNAYVYRWSMQPETGLALELRVAAPSAVIARRELRRFLVAHDRDSWTVECVGREAVRVPHAPLVLPTVRHQ